MKLAALFLVFGVLGYGAPEVGVWGRFEASVSNDKAYSEPYGDVALDVVYTAPDGREIEFWGFYDGGSNWKIRFMPDAVGEWRYVARFSDGEPGVSGSFECVPSTLPGLISVYEENPVWFGYKRGDAVQLRSLHVGDRFFARNWSSAERTALLDWLGGQGYNMLSIASHYLNRTVSGRGAEWETPDLWPLNAAEYQRMEGVLDELARRKILVYPFAGFFGKQSDYPRDRANQEKYVRYTLARLGPYWNLFFNVAGPEPNLRDTWMSAKDVVWLGRLIQRLDPFEHLLSVHNQTGDDPYVASTWTDYGILQGPKTVTRKRLSEGLLRNHHHSKPLYAQETLWTGNMYHKEPYTDVDLRKNAYVIMMSAAALNYGDMNGNSSSGFSGTLDPAERFQERHDIVKQVWDFFDGIPFYEMVPRQDLVDNGYCLAAPARRYLVYLERSGTVSVDVIDSVYDVEWINAQDTADVRKAGTTEDGSSLTTPDGGDDWLLHLVARPGPELE